MSRIVIEFLFLNSRGWWDFIRWKLNRIDVCIWGCLSSTHPPPSSLQFIFSSTCCSNFSKKLFRPIAKHCIGFSCAFSVVAAVADESSTLREIIIAVVAEDKKNYNLEHNVNMHNSGGLHSFFFRPKQLLCSSSWKHHESIINEIFD